MWRRTGAGKLPEPEDVAIRAFDVGPLRSVRRAAAENLGNLVVLAGPNGSGKSTILDLLRQRRGFLAEPGTQVLFVGPHRTWRSSSLTKSSLYAFPMTTFADLLANDNYPMINGYSPELQRFQSISGTLREAGGAEEAPAFVKTALARLSDRQQTLVTQAWKANNHEVSSGQVPDLLAPFARLVDLLLPHLRFDGVDDSEPTRIRVGFTPAGRAEPWFDLDDLSSGEKAAIALLLPLVESQAEQLERDTKQGAVASTGSPELQIVPLTMLLDEPEIHLHPLLQLQVLRYLRTLAAEGTAQFIMSTHSTTLLDALDDDELYLVSPADIAPGNQLSRLTTSQERLEVAREITGSTHLLTRAKPVVFLEGETERAGVSSDVRLITSLLPATASWALVPGRAKRDVISSVARLREDGLDLPGTPVFGIVDADTHTDFDTSSPYVVSWPVAMVENLLLDSDAIYALLAPFGTQTRASSPAAVQAALEDAAASRTDDEVRLRVQRQLPIGRLDLRPDELNDAEKVAQKAADAWLAKLGRLDLPALTEQARFEVDAIISKRTQLDRFHGKRLLERVYTTLGVQMAGLGRPGFALLVAAQPAAKARALRLASPALERIRLFFPAGLAPLLQEAGVDNLAGQCRVEYDAWAAGEPLALNRLELRAALFECGRGLPGPQRQPLLELAAQIGTP